MTRIFVGVVVGGLLTACGTTDLNKPCPLRKKNPDGGFIGVQIRQSEIAAVVGNNKDFITKGSAECDDRYCVRDSNMGFLTDGAGVMLDVVAFGYCSRHCRQNESCPSSDPALDQGATKLVCRPLLLDVETLANAEISGVTDPYFCARTADGG